MNVQDKINVLAVDIYLEAGRNFLNHSDIGSIQFLAVIKLRSPFPCWLSSSSCSEGSEGIHVPLAWPPSPSSQQWCVLLESLTSSSAISQKAHLMRLGLARLSLFV